MEDLVSRKEQMTLEFAYAEGVEWRLYDSSYITRRRLRQENNREGERDRILVSR